MSLLPPQTIARVLARARSENLLTDERPWAVFFDLDLFESRLQRLVHAFPPDTLHAVAIKANPVLAILRHIVKQGLGLEAASEAEVALAIAAGCNPTRIVFDSPAKTRPELLRALNTGLHINADNLDELARIDELIEDHHRPSVGIRINPIIGPGTISITSVATKNSKFGVPLDLQGDELLEAFARYPWLNGLHVHVGSQGMSPEGLVEGVRRAYLFAKAIEKACAQPRVEILDIGGGLSFDYQTGEDQFPIETYAKDLQTALPDLFNGPLKIITELGRWLHAPCAFAASRIEYIKPAHSTTLLTIHCGADLLLRRAYRPEDWDHRVSLHAPDGAPLDTPLRPTTIAGPLCFSGDLLTHERLLPTCATDSLAIVHDIGAYTFSMWSRYCSRPFPPILGFRSSNFDTPLELLHPGESPTDLVNFWQ